MVVFHRDLMDEHERAEAERDVGVGLALCYEWPDSTAAALPLLEAALLGRPDDVTAWETKGIVLGRLGRREEALAALRTCPGPGTEPGIDPDATRRTTPRLWGNARTPLPTGDASSPLILGVNSTTRNWPFCCPRFATGAARPTSAVRPSA